MKIYAKKMEIENIPVVKIPPGASTVHFWKTKFLEKSFQWYLRHQRANSSKRFLLQCLLRIRGQLNEAVCSYALWQLSKQVGAAGREPGGSAKQRARELEDLWENSKEKRGSRKVEAKKIEKEAAARLGSSKAKKEMNICV